MKVLIISGFLGAGKTTFIRAMAKLSGREFAVLENEYGGENIDGEILEQSLQSGQVSIWELTERCICCSAKGDFAASVLTIANSVDPEYLVIEPTGVGMLSKIMENVRQIEYERISLLEPVTIVDGHSIDRYLKEYGDLYRDQVSSAAVIFVSKMESASADERARVEGTLRSLNPSARIVTTHYSEMSEDEWGALLEHESEASGKPARRADGQGGEQGSSQGGSQGGEDGKEREADLPDTFSMDRVSVERPEEVLLLLEDLIRGRFGNVIRAKGVIHVKKGEGVEEQMLRFDVADRLYSVVGEENLSAGRAVFIGKGIERQALRRILARDLFADGAVTGALVGRLSRQAKPVRSGAHDEKDEKNGYEKRANARVEYAPKKP